MIPFVCLNTILIQCSFLHIRNKTCINTKWLFPLHRVLVGIPIIKFANYRDFLRMWRPYCKINTLFFTIIYNVSSSSSCLVFYKSHNEFPDQTNNGLILRFRMLLFYFFPPYFHLPSLFGIYVYYTLATHKKKEFCHQNSFFLLSKILFLQNNS